MDKGENTLIGQVRIDGSADEKQAQRIRERFGVGDFLEGGLILNLDKDGLSLISPDGLKLKGDFSRMIPRIKSNNLGKELLVRAAKIKDHSGGLTAIDATAGLGEDSLLLAAAGFRVKMYERNTVIYELLWDSLLRAKAVPELSDIVARMELYNEDSVYAMENMSDPVDVVLLDPMFPERQKSSLVKKKLQVIQRIESPCDNESELFLAAVRAKPKKLIIKRPPKGEHLAGIKPDHSLGGKAVRYDCFVSPYERINKFIDK